MSPLHVQGDKTFRMIPDDYLLVGLDETGHEDLIPDVHPVFGLGGCAVPVGLYSTFVHEPWCALKESCFQGATTALHASELRDPSPAQVGGLTAFFKTQRFGRIAAVMSVETLLEPALHSYQLLARSVLERIASLVGSFGCRGVALIMEESTRGDRLAAACFSGYHLELRDTGAGVTLPFIKYRMPKSASASLLEVSDFIIHVAGSQVRSVRKGVPWDARRDFDALFRSVDPALAQFMDITEALIEPPST
jgi:hypothetical protein